MDILPFRKSVGVVILASTRGTNSVSLTIILNVLNLLNPLPDVIHNRILAL